VNTVVPQTLWAPRAWLPDGWREQVQLRIGHDGRWAEVRADVATPAAGATVLDRPVLPGLVNAHSHAFQRAFAGLAERRETSSDDFWSWRERMYGVALRITPEQMRAVATQLYIELLQGGYTQVCEFHYLNHDTDGQPYADPLAMAWALTEAAANSGIGLTLLPVLYERAGFREDRLRADQRRFASSAQSVWAAAARISERRQPCVNAGLAIHSLRAATPDAIRQLCRSAESFAGPIHVHVAEQTAEVDDCVAATGCRPIEWLAREGILDTRWQLVHATHTTPSEIYAVARSGAGIVICPCTEANLGDGLPDLPAWLAGRVPLAIGSDSQVTRDWREELRWLDYGQRLALRRRNVAAAPQAGQSATAANLFSATLAGGAAAAGMGDEPWGLCVGARADALLPDAHDPALLAIPPTHWLDSLVFSSPGLRWRDVMVAGCWVIRDHHHAQGKAVSAAFTAAMARLGD
jgi:formimidoylglutamate deiminase